MTATELTQIGADLEAMAVAASGEDLAAWDRAHGSFHIRLIFGVEPALRHQIRLMMSRADRYRRMSVLAERPASWEISEREHATIAAACEAREAERAGLLLGRHLARSAGAVLAHLAPEWEPTALPAALAMVEAGRAPARG